MDKYTELDETSLNPNKNHCVFASIYCKDAKPYYKKVNKNKQKNNNSIVFMQMRWDGSIGFPGGKVSSEELLKNGQVTVDILKNSLIRELEEEIDIDKDFIKKDKLKHLTSYIGTKVIIHNFSYEITFNEMLKLYNKSCLSPAIGSENLGNMLVHIYKYSKQKGLGNFLQNKFCYTCKYELLELIDTENLLFLQNMDYELNDKIIVPKVIIEDVFVDSKNINNTDFKINKVEYEFDD